ncbi:MAG: hypothetical protein HDP28_02535 [Clostridia bacterium]|nr:hypothetical protein [Clostridia bacterium]
MNDEFDESENGESVDSENEKTENAESNKEEKSISSDLIRGHINTIILRSLLDSDKYGYEIIAEIEKKSHGQYSLKQPSLYSALKRLETQGFVTSYWGGTAGGGRRKYFSLTEDGKKIADQNCSEWEYSRTIIDSLISDKDFDFSNPIPSAVNMRVLKEATSRVPSREGRGNDDDYEEDEGRVKELEDRYNELLAEHERVREELTESREREEYYRSERFTSSGSELDDDERARYQSIIRGRDEIISNLDARYEELLEKEKQELTEKERERYEELLNAEREQFQREQEELRSQYEELIQREDGRLTDEERERYEEIIRDREARLESVQARYSEHLESSSYLSEDEREHYENLLREQQEKLEEETARYQRELEEQAMLFREREREIRHQNYINLINTPPAAEPDGEGFDHYTPPRVEEAPEDFEPQEEAPQQDYRSVVDKLYASSIRTDTPPVEFKEENASARSLDGIDFHDIEAKAAQDGIKIITSGKTEKTKQQASASIVHKGKALFLSALLLFFLTVAEGAIVLGLQGTYGISIAYPCILWGIGLIILLVTGLAYANHYGEHSLRKPTPALINTIVLYILSVIVTLIVALAVNIDFHSAKALACFVVIPVIYLFGIVVFGTTYYLQIRPKK